MINFKHNIKTLYTVFKRIKSKMIFRDKKNIQKIYQYQSNLSIKPLQYNFIWIIIKNSKIFKYLMLLLLWIEIENLIYSMLKTKYNSRLGIIGLANKIKIYTNLIKLFHFEICIILFLFKTSKYVLTFGNITWTNIFIITRRKSDANMRFFLFSDLNSNKKKVFS
jgi:hypothetical protein